jgi:hypothetical protein
MRTQVINKEQLIDHILDLDIFSNRVQATQFINTIEMTCDGMLSMKDFLLAVAGVHDAEQVKLMKIFAHSVGEKA